MPADRLQEAADALEPAVRAALLESIARARRVHLDQRRSRRHHRGRARAARVTERWLPVDRVGLYVPGGRAVYPSSVIMNVVPAQVAGVASLAVVSPAAARLRRLAAPDDPRGLLPARASRRCTRSAAPRRSRCWPTGSTCPTAAAASPVDLVTGPGNIYVTAAKRALQGVIGIDSEAGPTEVMILADDTADAAHVAADLISQAEHDVIAAAVLVTDPPSWPTAVESELVRQVAATKHVERITEALGGTQSAIVLVDDLEAGLRIVDAYAAEHLEIHTRDAREWAMRVRNAGAIFVGTYSPVSLGDYAAGSNHVLPTAGSARHSSGLSVQSFLRGIHVVEYDEHALRDVAPHVLALSAAEDLPGHGDAIRVRFAALGDQR